MKIIILVFTSILLTYLCLLSSTHQRELATRDVNVMKDVLTDSLYEDMLDVIRLMNEPSGFPLIDFFACTTSYPDRSTYKREYLTYVSTLTCPISGLQLHVFSQFGFISDTYFIVAKGLRENGPDSVWVLLGDTNKKSELYGHPFQIASYVGIVNEQLEINPLTKLDSTLAIDVATLPLILSKTVRALDPVLLSSWRDIPVLPSEQEEEHDLPWKEDADLKFLRGIAPPHAKPTDSGYSVVVFYWTNETLIRSTTMEVTLGRVTLTRNVAVGYFGTEIIRVD